MSNDLYGRLPADLASGLRLPAIVAPMLRVSGPDLVEAACRAGVIGCFPTFNARTPAGLDSWLDRFSRLEGAAPFAANLVMYHPTMPDHLACLVNHRVPLVITSVGSPRPAVSALHDVGSLVFSDVATLAHARKAVAAGVDGLVLLTAGSGGQTGWLNPFAFVRAVRDFYDGPVVLAGGMADGVAIRASIELGADLAYLGTRFIAAGESLASADYRRRLVDCDSDDVMLTSAFTGRPTSFLRPAVVAAGLDPDRLDEEVTPEIADAVYGGRATGPQPKRWTDIVTAGHSVSGVRAVMSVSAIVDELIAGYRGVAEPAG